MAHKFKKSEWNPVKKPGSETARAKRAGRSLKAQAEHDEHSPDKKIRGKGIFALNAMEHKFGGKKKHGTAMKGKSAGGRRRGKKSTKRRTKQMFK